MRRVAPGSDRLRDYAGFAAVQSWQLGHILDGVPVQCSSGQSEAGPRSLSAILISSTQPRTRAKLPGSFAASRSAYRADINSSTRLWLVSSPSVGLFSQRRQRTRSCIAGHYITRLGLRSFHGDGVCSKSAPAARRESSRAKSKNALTPADRFRSPG
jgi:hypothetical protein